MTSEPIHLPGLIDLHAHPARAGSKHGVDPDVHYLPRGVTTVLSQGDAGADNFDAYLEHTIRHCRTRVRLAINLSRIGESTPGGALSNLDDADVDACVAAIERGGEHIPAVACNIDRNDAGDTDPRELIRRAVAVAEATGRFILFGMRTTDDLSFEEQLGRLRPGDVVTYMFRTQPHFIVENGRVHPALWEAKKRGILFDVGHGAGSFDFAVAETAISEGFLPDTVSTDAHHAHVNWDPPHDLPRTMSKLIAAGMSEQDVFAAVTTTPARLLKIDLDDADQTVLHWSNTAAPLIDVNGNTRPGPCLEPVQTVCDGRIVR